MSKPISFLDYNTTLGDSFSTTLAFNETSFSPVQSWSYTVVKRSISSWRDKTGTWFFKNLSYEDIRIPAAYAFIDDFAWILELESDSDAF